jgi:hypothetical protein
VSVPERKSVKHKNGKINKFYWKIDSLHLVGIDNYRGFAFSK